MLFVCYSDNSISLPSFSNCNHNSHCMLSGALDPVLLKTHLNIRHIIVVMAQLS